MKSVYFQHGGATAKLDMWEMNLGFVRSVFSRRRGQGHARALMEEIVKYADEKELILVLDVQRYGYRDSQALSNKQLIEFYEKFDFELKTLRDPTRMVRQPKGSQELHAP